MSRTSPIGLESNTFGRENHKIHGIGERILAFKTHPEREEEALSVAEIVRFPSPGIAYRKKDRSPQRAQSKGKRPDPECRTEEQANVVLRREGLEMLREEESQPRNARKARKGRKKRLGEDTSPYQVRDSESGKRMRHWGMKWREQGCSRYHGKIRFAGENCLPQRSHRTQSG